MRLPTMNGICGGELGGVAPSGLGVWWYMGAPGLDWRGWFVVMGGLPGVWFRAVGPW